MAADQNNEAAILSLALLYTQGGPNLESNHEEAANWYKKAAYEGSIPAQNGLANLYFDDKAYYDAYVWCCVSEMTEEHFINGMDTGLLTGAVIGGVGAALGAPLLPLLAVGAVIGAISGGMDDYTVKEQIEGRGIFNLAKLSDAEMENAKHEAEKIASQISERIKQRQQ